MLGSKKKQMKVNRSRSKSPQRSQNKLKQKSSGKIGLKSGKKNNNRKSIQNPSLIKSQSKRSLNQSASHKKLNRSVSQPKRVGSSPGVHKKKDPKAGLRERSRSQSKEKVKGSRVKEAVKPTEANGGIRSEEKDMGLIFVRPEYDKIVFKGLDITDSVFDKYL